MVRGRARVGVWGGGGEGRGVHLGGSFSSRLVYCFSLMFCFTLFVRNSLVVTRYPFYLFFSLTSIHSALLFLFLRHPFFFYFSQLGLPFIPVSLLFFCISHLLFRFPIIPANPLNRVRVRGRGRIRGRGRVRIRRRGRRRIEEE